MNKELLIDCPECRTPVSRAQSSADIPRGTKLKCACGHTFVYPVNGIETATPTLLNDWYENADVLFEKESKSIDGNRDRLKYMLICINHKISVVYQQNRIIMNALRVDNV
jgi:hypothetical protein